MCVFLFFLPRTPLGRARAWLRLALMQKRLADYLRLLITRKDLLRYKHIQSDSHTEVSCIAKINSTCFREYTCLNPIITQIFIKYSQSSERLITL